MLPHGLKQRSDDPVISAKAYRRLWDTITRTVGLHHKVVSVAQAGCIVGPVNAACTQWQQWQEGV